MELYLSYKNLTKIPKDLPDSLLELYCHYNQISKLENLPKSLQRLTCYSNQISKLENLPKSLQTLTCYSNQISKLENLPESLQELWCRDNKISKLEKLPRCLDYIIFDKDKIKFIDDLSIHYFNSNDCYYYKGIKKYQVFRRFQMRIKWRLQKKLLAAEFIHEKCYNWVWKGITKDNKEGINIRIQMKFLREEYGMF
jgi:Leucine-rich repeat (LRR) protein